VAEGVVQDVARRHLSSAGRTLTSSVERMRGALASAVHHATVLKLVEV
jgi:hypothetical protein